MSENEAPETPAAVVEKTKPRRKTKHHHARREPKVAKGAGSEVTAPAVTSSKDLYTAARELRATEHELDRRETIAKRGLVTEERAGLYRYVGGPGRPSGVFPIRGPRHGPAARHTDFCRCDRVLERPLTGTPKLWPGVVIEVFEGDDAGDGGSDSVFGPLYERLSPEEAKLAVSLEQLYRFRAVEAEVTRATAVAAELERIIASQQANVERAQARLQEEQEILANRIGLREPAAEKVSIAEDARAAFLENVGPEAEARIAAAETILRGPGEPAARAASTSGKGVYGPRGFIPADPVERARRDGAFLAPRSDDMQRGSTPALRGELAPTATTINLANGDED